jgi:4-amino-4-deoxy-L-arabinose transferase-like glycosyltransferase
MAGGKVVSSLSWLSNRLPGSLFKDRYTLGQIVVDIIFAGAVICLFVLTRGPKQIFDVNPQSARGLLIGIVAVVLWYAVTITDLFLHEARISVPYNYFFVDVAISALKFCAEGFFVATTYRLVVLHLQQQMRKAKAVLILGEVLILTLLVTALYSLGSLIARQIVWLQLADEKTRNSFAWPQRKFDAAFYCIQFCMSFLTSVFAGMNGWIIHHTTGQITAVCPRLEFSQIMLLTISPTYRLLTGSSGQR